MNERIIENNQTGEQLYFLSDETLTRVVNQSAKQEVNKAIVLTFLGSVLGFCLLTLIASRISPRQCIEPYPDPIHHEKDSTLEQPNWGRSEGIRSL